MLGGAESVEANILGETEFLQMAPELPLRSGRITGVDFSCLTGYTCRQVWEEPTMVVSQATFLAVCWAVLVSWMPC